MINAVGMPFNPVKHIHNYSQQMFDSIVPSKEVSLWALVSSQYLPSVIQLQRIKLIRSRVALLAAAFSVLAVLWSVVDAMVFPFAVWIKLFAERCAVSMMFAWVARSARRVETVTRTFVMLGSVVALLTLFYLFCRPPEGLHNYSTFEDVVTTSYSLLPFLIFSIFGIFPLTLMESTIFLWALLEIYVGAEFYMPFSHVLTYGLGGVWIMILLGCISAFTGLSQLNLFIAQISLAAHDPLTKCLSRRYGQEALEVVWNLDERHDACFSMAFVDLDNFKHVNDTYGHSAGDVILSNAADIIMKVVRKSDLVIRWGGEEFLIILPDTDAAAALVCIKRLYEKGFGLKPDQSPQTASIGIAERKLDEVKTWQELVRIADERLYAAKTAGKNRFIAPDLFTPVATIA